MDEREAQIAQICMGFMNRCEIKGSEVMHFVACMQWLESKAGLHNAPPGEPLAPPLTEGEPEAPPRPGRKARKG